MYFPLWCKQQWLIIRRHKEADTLNSVRHYEAFKLTDIKVKMKEEQSNIIMNQVQMMKITASLQRW